mmetsp:Transcript_24311/g.91802  ORF Transcript_24311/g.91802 Transcript_24311/m.91802 type:complete len:227 (-) Transcript_24311:499-1179(-)
MFPTPQPRPPRRTRLLLRWRPSLTTQTGWSRQWEHASPSRRRCKQPPRAASSQGRVPAPLPSRQRRGSRVAGLRRLRLATLGKCATSTPSRSTRRPAWPVPARTPRTKGTRRGGSRRGEDSPCSELGSSTSALRAARQSRAAAWTRLTQSSSASQMRAAAGATRKAGLAAGTTGRETRLSPLWTSFRLLSRLRLRSWSDAAWTSAGSACAGGSLLARCRFWSTTPR